MVEGSVKSGACCVLYVAGGCGGLVCEGVERKEFVREKKVLALEVNQHCAMQGKKEKAGSAHSQVVAMAWLSQDRMHRSLTAR